MTTSKALVFDIKRFAVHDGDGFVQRFSSKVVPFVVYGVKIPKESQLYANPFIFKITVYIVVVVKSMRKKDK